MACCLAWAHGDAGGCAQWWVQCWEEWDRSVFAGRAAGGVAGGGGGHVHRVVAGLVAGASGGVEFAPDGTVLVGAAFRELEAAWAAGIAAMVRAGARVIIDEVLLGGGAGQRRWGAALAGLEVLWVGVRCPAEVAAGRELARGDRITGMAAGQAELVHVGMRYDVEVSTVGVESVECARVIAARVDG